jgi:glutamine cyclotransferase
VALFAFTEFHWDVTGDGQVGMNDIILVAQHFGQQPMHPDWNPLYDITGDNYVGIDDLVEICEHVDLPLYFAYTVVNVYPHDSAAFTQGLVFEDGVLYEGTGLYGFSTLRRVELETGAILQLYTLADEFFGEGITIFHDKIIQLTWLSHKGFVYDKCSFRLLQEFNYPTEGWGITHDGGQLIMSDGTAMLYFLDPETFERTGQIEVYDSAPVSRLNELEYINGAVYANIWLEEKIAVISPQTGQVKAWIDIAGIQATSNIVNGIAYDARDHRLFITGKRWSELFEIRLVPSNSP